MQSKNVLNEFIGNTKQNIDAVFDIAVEASIDEVHGMFGEPGHNDCEAKTNVMNTFLERMGGVERAKGSLIAVGATD